MTRNKSGTAMAAAVVAILLSIAISSADADRIRYIGLTQATLLSGSTLTACSGASVNTTGCSNGMAAVAYVQRKYLAANGRTPAVIPFIDRQTAFVQMYPATWAVNVPILSRFDLATTTAPPSIFTSEERTSWEYFHNTSAFKVLLANVNLPASDKWFTSYLPYTIIEGVGVILVDSNTSPNTIDPYTVIDNILSSFALRRSVNATMVIFADSLISGTTVYNSIGALKPTVIVPFVSSAASTFVLGTTLIVPITLSSSTVSFVNLTLDDATGTVLAASIKLESLAIPVGTADSQYYADQVFLDGYATVAGQNDPILGSSGLMPVHRDGNMRLCLGGECPGGRLYAEAMRFTRKTDIAFTSSGAFRGNGWPAGTFKISDVWATNPFANAVCYGKVRGLSLLQIFNYSIALTTAPAAVASALGDRLLQTAGVRIVFNQALQYTRIISIHILDRATGKYEPLDKLKLYSYAADSYVSLTFSPFPTWLAGQYDGEVAPTCLSSDIMQTAVTSYMANISTFNTTDQGSLTYSSSSSPINNFVQVQADCSPGTKWVASLGSCTACPSGQSSAGGTTTCTPETKSNIATILAIAVPLGAAALALFAAYMIHAELEKRKNVRNVDNAPKSGEVTLMFTDIQDSTKLWGTCPASMSISLDHHHRLIRECIARHKGYEVKTVGDCFMIAVGDVNAAVSLALDIQFALQNQPFPEAIANVYRCTTEEELDAIDDNPDNLAELDPLFNGLRVRIGMHTGSPDVVFDEVTKGYDYYGPPVNVSARVESTAKGGQINATRDLVSRMAERDDLEVVYYNAVELKGVAGLTEILHIVPKSLSARVAIYQAMSKQEKESDSAGSNRSDDVQSMMSGAANQDVEVVKRFTACILAAVKVMKPKDQREMIRSMCKSWRVKAPSKELPLEDEIKLFAGRATRGMKRTEAEFGSFRAMSMRRPSMMSGGGTEPGAMAGVAAGCPEIAATTKLPGAPEDGSPTPSPS